MRNPFDSIEKASADIQAGKMIVLMDDESRENEGDLVLAAEKITPEAVNFMSRQACGLICLSLQSEDFIRLQIPMMTEKNSTPHQTAFGVSFEAATGVSTGISAQDRAHTIAVAIHPNSTAKDIITPGHMFPLRAVPGGVLQRRGHTEGSSDLVKIAGCKPASVICEIMNEDGSMARLPDLIQFTKKHGLALIRISDIINYRLQHETLVAPMASATLPIAKLGNFTITVFQDFIHQQEHLAIIANQPGTTPLVRLHSECLTGDVFDSERCDCGQQLQIALHQIAQQGGVLLYLRQEGRGIGLANKIKAYALQEKGFDTVEANHQLGFHADEREYNIAAQILKSLHLQQIRLLTNNPKKVTALNALGITVSERVSIETTPNQNNLRYLTTKRNKLGHWLNFNTIKDLIHEK